MKRGIAILFAFTLLFYVVTAAAVEPKRYFVTLSSGADASIVEKYGEIRYSYNTMPVVSAILSEEAVELLRKEAGVEKVEEVPVHQISEEEQTEWQSELGDGTLQSMTIEQKSIPWNLTEEGANVEAAWQNFAVDGEGVKIAIIDSGVNHSLADLDDYYLGGYDFAYDDEEPDDYLDRGTYRASIILADGQDQITGIAPKAQYYALKIYRDDGWAYDDDVAAAIEWAIERNVDIIFFGYASSAWTSIVWNPVRVAFATGIVLLGGSIERGYNYAYCPACYPEVVSVGAHTESQQILPNSNGGVDVVAPGENIVGLSKDGEIVTVSGTRPAAAHAAGSIALMMQLAKRNGKQYSNAYYRETLMHSAIDLGLDPAYQGTGKVDANAALTWLANNWFLEYKVNYLNSNARDRAGTPIYYKGEQMQYSISITNHSDQIINSKPIRDLNIVSKQTINGTEHEFYTVIPALLAGETQTVGPYAISIPKQFSIPPDWEPSTRNTQVVLKKEREVNHWPPSPWFVLKLTSVLENDDRAGAFKVADEPVTPVKFCTDSDSGVDPFVFGTCTDSRGVSVSDKSMQFNGKSYVMEAFCLTAEMREHCKLYNGEEYCNELPNDCYSLPLIPSTGLAWTYFDYSEALFCPNGSRNGACTLLPSCSAGWKCKDSSNRAFQNEKCMWGQEEYCEFGCLNGECVQPEGMALSGNPTDNNAVIDANALDENVGRPDENVADENIAQPDENFLDENIADENTADENVSDENSAEPPLQQLGALQTETEPEPAADPPAQNTGNGGSRGSGGGSGGSGGGGGGGYYSNNNKAALAIEQSVEENTAQNETEANAVTIMGVKPRREMQTEPETMQPTALPAENNASPAGFAVLAQNALNAIIVTIAGAVALAGKLFFK